MNVTILNSLHEQKKFMREQIGPHCTRRNLYYYYCADPFLLRSFNQGSPSWGGGSPPHPDLTIPVWNSVLHLVDTWDWFRLALGYSDCKPAIQPPFFAIPRCCQGDGAPSHSRLKRHGSLAPPGTAPSLAKTRCRDFSSQRGILSVHSVLPRPPPK